MSYIEVECESCEKLHKINKSEFEFESIEVSERQMGAEVTYEGVVEIQCDCGNTITVTHRFWEYPEGSENDNETDISGAEII